MLKLGIWTPLPHVVRAEPAMEQGIRDVQSPGMLNAPDVSLDFAVQIVTEAERLGFDVTLIAERWLGPDHAAWILATALACQTHRMEIMVAVHPGMMAPQMVAKMGATLDRVSRGRFSINVVNGWWQEEMDQFGNGAWLPGAASRYQRMDEFIQVLRGLWTQESLRFKGDYFAVDGLALPMRPVQPCPPIYAASRADAGKAIVAQHCDWWFVEYDPERFDFDATLRKVKQDIADMRVRAAREGRMVRFGLSAHVITADTVAQAEAEADTLEEYGQQNRIASVSAKALGAGLVGTPERVAARLRAYEAAGVECVMLRFHPMLDGLQRFARDVMPLLGKAIDFLSTVVQ